LVDPNTGQIITVPHQPIMPTNSWDNHQAHIDFHNRFRKSQQFELLPNVIQAIFEEHVQQHQAILGGINPMDTSNPIPAGQDMEQQGNMEQPVDNTQQGAPQDQQPPTGA
jgi:hypothetical protein